jgi:hypothetical protein
VSDANGRAASPSRLVVTVVVLGLVAVAGILLAGPTRLGKPLWDGGVLPFPRVTLPPHAEHSPSLPTQPPATPRGVSIDGPLILTVLGLGVLLVGAVLLVLWLLRRSRRLGASRLSRRQLADTDPGPDQPEPASDPAPAVSRGIARALELLDGSRAPSDAVVEAWLGLQEAAADSGVPRRAAETPAEYATRLIVRLDADRRAADTLLRLYQDVRFGTHAASAADVRLARDCLLRLRESWHETTGPQA